MQSIKRLRELRIKRLDLFILKTFFPLFLMTFFISLFIVLMQFLWKNIDDLVGKGLSLDLIGELFFYAALNMVPLALPLAILLASLMVFGNLGEHFELTAMKSSGVSLFRVMAPLICFVSIVSVGAFFFQNDVLPKSQVKMWTLLFSMRQKSPELDIPEGAFYDQISGYNLFVKQKNRDTGVLYDLMIYDVSKGYGYANVMLADSGKLSFTEDKKYLFLQLWKGESFQDLKDSRTTYSTDNGRLYERESFDDRTILIPFDANFNRMDDESMRSQYIAKDLAALSHTIDSVGHKVDSVSTTIYEEIATRNLVGVPQVRVEYNDTNRVTHKVTPVKMDKPLNLDTILGKALTNAERELVLSDALQRSANFKQDYSLKGMEVGDDLYIIRRHQIEMLRKFTLSLACLIFFFIGAPLGAIIRKGGIGTPVVISVILFIIYYIIDNFGYKQARDGRWDVWLGIWLSSIVLLPLGVFLTKKAINDSAVFNPDAYRNFVRRKFGVQDARKLEMKEVIIHDVNRDVAIEKLDALIAKISEFLQVNPKRQRYYDYFVKGFDSNAIKALIAEIEALVEYLSNSDKRLVINKTMDYPMLNDMLVYHCGTGNKWVARAILAIAPVSLPLFLFGRSFQQSLINDLKTAIRVSEELKELV